MKGKPCNENRDNNRRISRCIKDHNTEKWYGVLYVVTQDKNTLLVKKNMGKRRADLSLKNNGCTFVIKVKSRERVSHGFRQNLSTDRHIDRLARWKWSGPCGRSSNDGVDEGMNSKSSCDRGYLYQKKSNEKPGTTAQHHYPLAKYFAVAVDWCWLKHCNIYSANIFSTALCRSHRPFATHLMLRAHQNPWFSLLLVSRPSPSRWSLDVWWSNPNIFKILMQNKQSQITHILPPCWFVEVVNQIKLPFLFPSFHLTHALSGSVLAGTLNWNSPKHRASFVVRLFFSTRCLWKRTGFSLLGSGPSITPLLPVWLAWSRSVLVNSPAWHTLFITHSSEV